MTVVGTRPEVIKLSRVLAELRTHTDHVLVHTGQNYAYELNEIFFKELEIAPPDHYLKAAGETYAETIGNVIAKADALIEKERPDAALILGDTNSALAAIAAKRRRVPVFHMEAGNRCFDDRVPEEVNRRIVDHVSDVNLPYTEHARRYLLAEGLPKDRVIKTGSPVREVINHYRAKVEASTVLSRLKLDRQGYFVVSAHREENVDEPEKLSRLIETLNAVAAEHQRPLIFSTHPRTRKRLGALKGGKPDPLVRFLDPLGFPDYVKLQSLAFCVLSDSGTLTEEASIVGFPGVMLRDQHERPEGMDEASVLMAGLGRERVLQAIDLVTRHGASFYAPSDYGPTNVSKKVVRIVLSYIDYVNRTVWHRP